MELRFSYWLGGAKLPQQELPEERVESVPLAAAALPACEAVGASQAAEDGGRVRPLGDGVGQRCRELVHDRDVPHELAVLGAQTVENLGGYVVTDLWHIAVEAARQAVRPVIVAKRLGGDRDGGRPPFAPVVEDRDGTRSKHRRSEVRCEKCRRFRVSERQVVRANLDQPALHTVSRQWQLGVSAADDDDLD
jgi:hypothetical protein